MSLREALILAVPFLIVLLAVLRGFRLSDLDVDRWVTSAGLRLSAESRPVVRRYLALGRRFRTIGALVGFVIAAAAVVLRAHQAAGVWILTLIGYLAGALIAEIALNPPRRGSGAALLVPRRLADYLPGYVLSLQRGLAVLCVAVAALSALSPHFMGARLVRAQWLFRNPSWFANSLGVIVFGIFGLLLFVLVEWVQRMIIGRSQPAVSRDELAVDDAMRSSSLHLLSGGVIALLLSLAAGQAMLLNAALPPWAPGFPKWGLALAGLVLWVASIAFWRDLSKPHGFSVHRAPAKELPA